MTAIKSRLPPRPCEHSLYKRQPKHMTGASSGFGGPLRVAQTECADLTRMNSKLNFSTPAEGSATYTFDKTAIHFERKPSSYVILNRYIERIARALESQFGALRGARLEIPSLAGDNGHCEADGSLPLHRGKTTLDYFKREYLSSKNRASAYGTSKCSRMLVGRAVARWEDAPAAYVTKRRRLPDRGASADRPCLVRARLSGSARSFHTRPSHKLRSADSRRAVLSRCIAGDIEMAQILPSPRALPRHGNDFVVAMTIPS